MEQPTESSQPPLEPAPTASSRGVWRRLWAALRDDRTEADVTRAMTSPTGRIIVWAALAALAVGVLLAAFGVL